MFYCKPYHIIFITSGRCWRRKRLQKDKDITRKTEESAASSSSTPSEIARGTSTARRGRRLTAAGNTTTMSYRYQYAATNQRSDAPSSYRNESPGIGNQGPSPEMRIDITLIGRGRGSRIESERMPIDMGRVMGMIIIIAGKTKGLTYLLVKHNSERYIITQIIELTYHVIYVH